MDPVTLSVMSAAFSGIAEEMGTVLVRSASSSNIKERRDCSAALFDADGRMVAQAEHIPVHLGAMPESVAAVIACDPQPGDVFILNDPFSGGSHLPDITLVSPLAPAGEILGYACTRAHHSDVGGIVPGSMPAGSTSIWQEGLIIPPVRLDESITRVILANVRTPELRRADLHAQAAAGRIAEQRLVELVERHGREPVLDAFDEVIAYAERRAREAIRRLPDGRYEAEGEVEGDGVTEDDLPIRVTVTIANDAIEIDFEGTSPAAPGTSTRRSRSRAPRAPSRSRLRSEPTFRSTPASTPPSRSGRRRAASCTRSTRPRWSPGTSRRASGSRTPCCSRSPRPPICPPRGRGR